MAFLVAIAVLCASCTMAAPLFKGDEPVPSDAIILFDGKDLSQWVACDSGGPAQWKVESGYVEIRNGDICSKQLFKNCQLHVEFWLPLMAQAKGQRRANSGVFFMGRVYEIQVLDSYGMESKPNDCGAVYSITAPMVNACRPPQQWQSYDIFFHAPKFDTGGKKTANARVTVFQNGVLIHDNVEFPYPTHNHKAAEPKDPGPIRLQDHHCAIRYRNIWVRPLQ